MIALWKWTLKSFQRNLAYRLEYFVSILNALLFMVIFTSIWQAVFQEGESRGGMTRALMVEYAVFATLIKTTISRSRDLLGERVRSGEIATDLMKPISIPMMLLADSVGSWMFQIVSRAMPLVVFAILFFDISFPAGLDAEFFLSYILSFLLFHAILLNFGVAAFFIVENFPLWLLNSSLISLLSGSILPLQILPSWVADFALWTPYPYLFYIPTMKLLKDDFPIEHALARQILALAVAYSIALFFYRLGRRRLYIQGG